MKNLLKKDGELKARYQYVISLILEGTKKFYLKRWAGTNKHRTLLESEYYNMLCVLNELNIRFEVGNDAPRGGVTGDYIQIISDRRNSNYNKLLKNELFK